MEMLLKRILTPKTSVDLLRDIAQAQLDSCLYTTCFIGVKLNVRNQVMGYDDNPRTIQSTTKGGGIMYRVMGRKPSCNIRLYLGDTD
ncbi:hypothetical protein GLOIN_2v1501668 [Rhizophagus irregularis DAOM 181602=DAOM 197198]|uniref:Uncharacterized protein n=1 Tax=Rhizophagus irregularis (strain DAOM 181602 / DAOM 197198 / MUCL 43194) TaxID=747089 RepID=A0A2P4QWF6_RHIID|nr:hypothetical protein GLOIN_2v1501668 [Rhizophagus irregularis DAOM 181602=DAOM 197198]POG81993.1 hypothetical protein GLOIN_2v1501668 [Rhizophagus irregularis DAOM 181602=DAOM 197198]|eukprot:XP_025188859.1 hypothetical protein GLOIN_2v1501668 [Rhizophagus irregularis DAOM 181602=DAOM 197198]